MNLDYTTLHFNSVISHFSDQFRNEEFLDCTLNAEGRSIKVHRAVLCAQSTLLEKMILEHIHVSDLFVTLDGVPFEDLKAVVQFMYDGWTRLSKANFGSFLVVAQLLGMKWVDYVQINVEEVDAAANEAREPLQNITNVDLPLRKRKKCMKTKRHSKKLKCTRAERRLALRPPQDIVEETSHETDLAQMDENTFCTALGLKKITDEDVLPKLKLVSRTKRMPSLIKINCEENKENEPEHSVFIEEKSLSFLNANANEMRIRENNIEIECDVLEATSQYVVYKGNAEEIVELREGNSDAANHYHSDHRLLDHHHRLHHHHGGSSSSSSSTGVVVNHRGSDAAAAAAVDDVPAEGSRKSSSSATSTSSRKSGSTAGKRRGGAAGGPKGLDGPAVFWCDVCQRTYHTKTGLNQHKRYECCKDPAFACPRCEKRFKRKSSLVRHAITLHDETIYPTRTKLLSKLTSLANRNILTIAGRFARKPPKRSSPRPSKSTHRMYMPGPSRKQPIVDLCRSSPIPITISDVARNSEKSKDVEGIVNLIIDDEDEYIDQLDSLTINIEDLSDSESVESDDDVVIIAEMMRDGNGWDSIVQNGDATSICNGEASSPLRIASSSPLRPASPELLSTSLCRMMSPTLNCECRPLKTYPGKRPAEPAVNGYPSASTSTPLAPGGKSAISPVARARLSCSDPQMGIRSQPPPADCLSPLKAAHHRTSPSAGVVLAVEALAVTAPSSPPPDVTPQLTKNLHVPRVPYMVPNSEIDEQTTEKYQLKNFSIHLSKAEFIQAIKHQEKLDFLEYFNVVERSKVPPQPPGRVKPLIIRGLKKKYPFVSKERVTRKRPRPLAVVRKNFEDLEHPAAKQAQVSRNVVFD